MSDLVFYGGLLAEIKDRIRQAQTRAALSANAEMIAMYWDIGRMIHKRQRAEGWGAGVIPRLAGDLKNELPEVKGFSERNIKRMLRFYREYQDLPQPVTNNVSGNPVAIEKACDEIAVGALERARKVISEQYPFFPPSNAGRQYSDYQKTKIFLRDGFIDRYSGDKLVFPAVLRLLSCLMPEEFPFHKNWKTSECHLAYWQLLPTVDHVVPVSRGGSDRESNWVCTSQLRNSAKSNWLLEELGWKLHEPGRVDDWDGMVHWYVEYIGQHAEFLEDKYLSSWYRAAKNAIET